MTLTRKDGAATGLTIFVVDIVVLWVGSTTRHIAHVPRKPIVAEHR